MSINGLRILHILSPVKWDGDTFNANADANFKVAEKTIRFCKNKARINIIYKYGKKSSRGIESNKQLCKNCMWLQ